ncbi:hypothetical protein K1719_028775 [Acacia pycnantha]|nr:hypothetical protein K1719_028775 [Acacia pycnantha]
MAPREKPAAVKSNAHVGLKEVHFRGVRRGPGEDTPPRLEIPQKEPCLARTFDTAPRRPRVPTTRRRTSVGQGQNQLPLPFRQCQPPNQPGQSKTADSSSRDREPARKTDSSSFDLNLSSRAGGSVTSLRPLPFPARSSQLPACRVPALFRSTSGVLLRRGLPCEHGSGSGLPWNRIRSAPFPGGEAVAKAWSVGKEDIDDMDAFSLGVDGPLHRHAIKTDEGIRKKHKINGPIKTVVVLVMENRSFDHVLGWLKSTRPEIDGLTARSQIDS